jgi:hypothetical protein
MRAVVARWGGYGYRAGFLSRLSGLVSRPLQLLYFDLTRFAFGFLVLGGGVFSSRLATSSKGIGLCAAAFRGFERFVDNRFTSDI